MTEGTGLPAGQRTCARNLRVAVVAAVVMAFCLDVHGAPADRSPSHSDPTLDSTMRLISSAFLTEKSDPLASLVPPGGKTFVSLRSAGGGAGYYSRDQVYFIFSRVFTQHDTVKFSIRRQKSDNPGKDFVYCVGLWFYHRHDGVDGDIQIHFVLSMRGGSWSLVEIREAL